MNEKCKKGCKKKFEVIHQVHINYRIGLLMCTGKRDGKAFLISAGFNYTVFK